MARILTLPRTVSRASEEGLVKVRFGMF